jgi:Heterokaryon incompatibility protein (HET)
MKDIFAPEIFKDVDLVEEWFRQDKYWNSPYSNDPDPEYEKRHSEKLRLWRSSDVWEYPLDNDFAESFFSHARRSRTPSFVSSSKLCHRCSKIDLREPVSLFFAQKAAETCDLCKMLSQCFKDAMDQPQVYLLDRYRPPPLRIYSPPGSKRLSDIQIGVPQLDDLDLRLVWREWLRYCDRNHDHLGCFDQYDLTKLPTRVIDVGTDHKSKRLWLYSPRGLEEERYIALSHCWGQLTEDEKRRFCTTSENIKQRYDQGFDSSILPLTFQDAVEVTRRLGVRYLWIDSLCIIQYGDDLSDWKHQSFQMQHVFRNAYCTIAATSADDPTKGFLNRREKTEGYVTVSTLNHGQVLICPAVDDFEVDVEQGVLNQRAWVLQERALSRRTIHFTAHQTYWECGGGIRCESFNAMQNTKALFLGDAKFPESLISRREPDKIELFQHLFTKYSELDITDLTDRPIAIDGLVNRLALTLETECQHGIFDAYLHRSLLWQRSGDSMMTRIQFKDLTVPSWSWMAYSGRIEYQTIAFKKVEWNQSVRRLGDIVECEVRRFQNCVLEQRADLSILQDRTDSTQALGLGQWWLKFDTQYWTDLQTLRCVVIGREVRKSAEASYLVLVVRRKAPKRHRTYERIGVGFISGRYLDQGQRWFSQDRIT